MVPAAMVLAAIAIAGCGSSSSGGTPVAGQAAAGSTLKLSISDAGRQSRFAAPASIKGGLVTVQLTNQGAAPHGAQLIRLLAGHTVAEALATLGAGGTRTPAWIRGEGGVGLTPPGSTVSATVELPAGSYMLLDLAGAEAERGGAPAYAPLSVSSGQSGNLPPSETTVTAANPSKDHYKWVISGPLKVGANTITFTSSGRQTIHELTAVRISGGETTAQLIGALETHGPPPSFVDVTSRTQTAVLDSGKSLSTQLTLSKPGTYVFFCHLTDRDGGRAHFAEGLITTLSVR